MAVTGWVGNLTILVGGSLEERTYSTWVGLSLAINLSISSFDGVFVDQEGVSPGCDGVGLEWRDFVLDSLGVFLVVLLLVWERPGGRRGGEGLYLSGYILFPPRAVWVLSLLWEFRAWCA
jgi:hypothetical protein